MKITLPAPRKFAAACLGALLNLAALAALSSPFAHGAPFSNGSFESPGMAAGTTTTDVTNGTIGPWTVAGPKVSYDKVGNPHGWTPFNGQHGVYFGEASSTGATLTQDFDTAVGQSYSVSCRVLQVGRAEAQGQAVSLEAFNGQASLAAASVTTIPLTGQYGRATYSFVASSTTTRLVIKDVTTGGGETDWCLDQVEVVAGALPKRRPGEVDTSFGTAGFDGIVTAPLLGAVRNMAIDSQERIVVVSEAYGGNFRVARFLKNGTPDTSFGGTGFLSIALSAYSLSYGVSVDASDRIVLAGYTSPGGYEVFTVVRLKTDGSLDNTFGGGTGVVTFAPFSVVRYDHAYAVAHQSDGRIVVVGEGDSGVGAYVALACLKTDGTFDGTFGNGGITKTDIGDSGAGGDRGLAVVLQSTGEIVVAARSQRGSVFDLAVLRYTSTGALDNTFNGSSATPGVCTIPAALTDGGRMLAGIALDGNGKIVVTSAMHNGTNEDVLVARVTSGGVLDATFNPTGALPGVVTTPIGPGNDKGAGIAVQSDGKIVVAGSTHNGVNSDFALLRYNSDGALDPTFGDGGITVSPFSTQEDRGYAVRVTSSGAFVVAGESAALGDGGVGYLTVARYAGVVLPTPDFSLDSDIDSALPYSSANPWTFKARLPKPLPPGTRMVVEATKTPNLGNSWSPIAEMPDPNAGNPNGTIQTWVISNVMTVPTLPGVYFRTHAFTSSDDTYSVVRGPYPPSGVPTPDFTLDSDISTFLPYSATKAWTFKARLAQPLDAGIVVFVQSSMDGTTWSDLPDGQMDNDSDGNFNTHGSAQTWVATSTQVPAGLAVRFRIAARANNVEKLSVVRGPLEVQPPVPMPPAKEFSVLKGKKKFTTAAQGDVLTFTAKQVEGSLTPGLRLHVEATTDGGNTWIAIPDAYLEAVRNKPGQFQLSTNLFPSGTVRFRIVTGAPGFGDGAGPMSDSFTITPKAVLVYETSVSSQSDPTGLFVHERETISYHLHVTNYGDVAATEVQVRLRLIQNFTEFTSATHDDNPNAFKLITKGAQIPTYFVGTLSPMASMDETVTCTVTDAAYPGLDIKVTEFQAQALGIPTASGPACATSVLGAFELKVSTSTTFARPGDKITYTLELTNNSDNDVKTVEVKQTVPRWVDLVSIQGLGDVGDGAVEGRIAVTPYDPLDGTQRKITWSFALLPARATFTAKFTVQVFWDVDQLEHVGDEIRIRDIRNTDYNAYALPASGGKPLIAYNDAPPAIVSELGALDDTPPRLVLTKYALPKSGTDYVTLNGIGTNPTVLPGGDFAYALFCRNRSGSNEAINAVIHDEIPANVYYNGGFARGGAPVSDFSNITFYNISGQPVAPTDYRSIRSFDIRLASPLVGDGDVDVFTYKVQAYPTVTAKTEIHSYAGGTVPPAKGATSIKTKRGFLVRARNLLRPVNGNPDAVLTYVKTLPVEVGPASIQTETFPVPAIPTRQGEFVKGQEIHFTMSYSVLGGDAGPGLRDHQIKVTLAAGLLPGPIDFFDQNDVIRQPDATGGPGLAEIKPDLSNPDKDADGNQIFIIQLGSLPGTPFDAARGGRFGKVRFTCYVPNPLPVTTKRLPGILNAAGQASLPGFITMQHSGSYLAPSSSLKLAGRHPVFSLLPERLQGKSFAEASAHYHAKDAGHLFIGIGGPKVVKRGGQVTFTVLFGNYADDPQTEGADDCLLSVQLPPGTTYKGASDLKVYQHGIQLKFTGFEKISQGLKAKTISWDAVSNLREHSAGAVNFTVEVPANYPYDSITIPTAYLTGRSAAGEPLGSCVVPCNPLSVKVLREESPKTGFFGGVQAFFSSLGGLNEKARAALEAQQALLADPESRSWVLGGADLVSLTNGSCVIQVRDHQVVVFGKASVVGALPDNIGSDDGQGCIVAIGHDTDSSILINNVGGTFGGNYKPGDLLASLRGPASIVAGGGGNIVAAGGGNLIGQDGASLLGNDGASLIPVATLVPNAANVVANDGAGILGQDAASILGQDAASLLGKNGAGFSLLLTGGGAIVAAGGGNYIDNAGNFHAGSKLLGQDGASIVAAGGGNIVAAGGGNVISSGGISALAVSVPAILANRPNGIVAAGGGNLVDIAAGRALISNIVAGGGMNVLSHNGNALAPNVR